MVNYESAFVSNYITTESLIMIYIWNRGYGHKKLICFENKMIITGYYFVSYAQCFLLVSFTVDYIMF